MDYSLYDLFFLSKGATSRSMQWLGWASGFSLISFITQLVKIRRVWEVAKKVFFTSVLLPQIKHPQDQRGCSAAESRRWSEGLPVWTNSSDTRAPCVCDRVVIQTSSSLNLPHVAKKREQRCKRKGPSSGSVMGQQRRWIERVIKYRGVQQQRSQPKEGA